MYSLLLSIIYISFISLGLPDSLLGSAWSVIYTQLDVPMSYAGIVTMLIAGGTIVSSLMSDWATKKFGAGVVTAVSVFMTAVALFGFSISNTFITLCIWTIPYGLGAGAVDAALNNYVALHYASRHMSWLHCFWGVGAAVSPYIMGYCLTNNMGWHSGYRIVSIIQIILSAIIFISLPLWKKNKNVVESHEEVIQSSGIGKAIKIKGVNFVLVTFFCYCALESTTGLWASSYLVKHYDVTVETAAKFASLFYLGITFGRFLCGFVADKLGDKFLIRCGIATVTVGILLIFANKTTALIGLIVIGFGCAPIYPSIIHATPYNFGKENSQAIIGIQMASAYTGSTFIPPIFGWIAENINIGLYPVYLMIFALVMFLMSEQLNKL